LPFCPYLINKFKKEKHENDFFPAGLCP